VPDLCPNVQGGGDALDQEHRTASLFASRPVPWLVVDWYNNRFSG
jgi:hypothetical protein